MGWFVLFAFLAGGMASGFEVAGDKVCSLDPVKVGNVVNVEAGCPQRPIPYDWDELNYAGPQR